MQVLGWCGKSDHFLWMAISEAALLLCTAMHLGPIVLPFGGASVPTLILVFVPQPLVLHQDSSILESRDLRLEKRTLFR